MENLFKRVISVVLIAVLFVYSIGNAVVYAGNNTVYNVKMKVTYNQKNARSMLGMINEFRTNEKQAWYWNPSDSKKIYSKNLSTLKYDYELEKIAMQRAAEIALSFSHTRPNGKTCFTAYEDFGYTYYSAAENIAVGFNSAESVFEAWKETELPYSGQGHRRNMLSEDVGAIGIACVTVNGYTHWVQVFSDKDRTVSRTTANNSSCSVKIEVLSSAITSKSVSIKPTKYSIHIKDSVSLPTVKVKITMKDMFSVYSNVTVMPDWSANDNIITINNNKITANSKGTTKISANVLGKKISVPVTVSDSHKLSIVNKKAATYFAKGYTGDTVCKSCGTVVKKGKATAKKTLKKPSVKVTPGKKQFKVKYNKVSGATGFEVQYKIGKKTVTKAFSTKKSVRKNIIKLKKGKYKVKVRAFVKAGKNKAYSKWTKTYSVRIK